MNTRDKMIEVILDGDMPMVAAKMSKSGEAENVEYVPLHKTVDRLIAAGFELVRKEIDFGKRKSVQPEEILELVRSGVRPILVCNKTVDNLGIDSPWELGMYARVKSIARNDEYGDDGFDVTVDLVEFSEINDGMATRSWHVKGKSGERATCKEAGWWTPEDTIWVPSRGFEMEMLG